MKSCIRCKKKKPLSEFYKHEKMADGHLSKCKTCCKIQSGKRETELRKNLVWLAKERERCRLKQEKLRKLGRAGKTSNTAKTAWRKRNRQKSRAHGVARKAHPKKPKKCQECKKSSKMLHRHHPDYNKPKEIIWLCPPCHGVKHRKQ